MVETVWEIPISHKWSLYQQNDERKITSTEWHNLVVRNKAAEICENICQKGIKYMLRAY
jgi:single-strand DNA-binding protein